jgi:hypothetical protein
MNFGSVPKYIQYPKDPNLVIGELVYQVPGLSLIPWVPSQFLESYQISVS